MLGDVFVVIVLLVALLLISLIIRGFIRKPFYKEEKAIKEAAFQKFFAAQQALKEKKKELKEKERELVEFKVAHRDELQEKMIRDTKAFIENKGWK